MRILHTSDWHLGQHFMGKTREDEHRLFINWLLKTIEQETVDAVVIAGDIFDTGVPPSYARKLYNQFIVGLQSAGCQQLVVIGGNHDSVATLHESRSLLEYLNTTVVGAASDNPESQVVVLNNRKGKPGAVLCAVPFIRPRDVVTSQSGESGDDKQKALLSAMTEHYQAIYTHARNKAQELGHWHALPVIATGHLTTVGGKVSESVREIYIGTLSAFPVSAFPPADYIALGHLHRGQLVAGNNHIRYSGSPIPLSFDEAGSSKQVLLADFDKGRLQEVTPVDAPLFRPLASIKSSLDDLGEKLEQFLGEQSDCSLTPWVEIVVEGDDYLSDLQSRIQDVADTLALEVLRVRRKRQASATGLAVEERETLAELKVNDVFIRRLAGEEFDDIRNEKLVSAFEKLVAEIEEEQVAEGVVQ
ncbi:exonuclease subunit SbcD [Sansalvadorimonas sp. 2012CJ34-2]|uniref:Nuclease SbcCD subunit D n=1 Tax=Parendozoicomonas callyspongiae TaxID=2942213 RepID=A0ABT0PDY0_9GAMM|nr:exonuclease subunit SbcD [Sansalvadorimonas sp. 2012CJ34-2]MCL6269582.1 exonuclease subunit SbcD [Sansalvadorimonas sp. 2012CJ34-2]